MAETLSGAKEFFQSVGPRLSGDVDFNKATPLGAELSKLRIEAGFEPVNEGELKELDAAINQLPLDENGDPVINQNIKSIAKQFTEGDETAAAAVLDRYKDKQWKAMGEFVVAWKRLSEASVTGKTTQTVSVDTEGLSESIVGAMASLMDRSGGADGDKEGGASLGTPEFEATMADLTLSQVDKMQENHFEDTAKKRNKSGRRLPVPFVVPSDPWLDFREAGNAGEAIKRPQRDRQIRLWEFVVDNLTRSGAYQRLTQGVAQVVMGNKGLQAPDYLVKLPNAMREVIMFADTIRKSSEKDTGQIWGKSPEPESLTAVDLMMSRPLVFRVKDGDANKDLNITFSTRRCRDVACGFDVETLRSPEGEPLYTNESIDEGEFITLSSLPDEASRKSFLNDPKTTLVFPTDNHPDFGRSIDAELYQTLSSSRMTLNGKEIFFTDTKNRIVDELKKNGLKYADIISFGHEDAEGRPLNRELDSANQAVALFRQDYMADNPTKTPKQVDEACVDYMLGELVYARYGMMSTLALDSCEAMQITPQWDPEQITDHLAEMWIKGFGQPQYEEKYTKEPAGFRQVVTAMLRPILAWKMKDVDALIIAMNGRHTQAYWRNPLRADKTRPIPPILTTDGKSLSPEQKNFIEAIVYAGTEWRTRSNVFPAFVNAIREEADNGDFAKVSELSAEGRRYYFARKEDSAPVQWPRSSMDAIAMVQGMTTAEREMVANIDFTSYLETVGYPKMDLDSLEYQGWAGLSKVIETRSTGHFIVGQLDKLFKNMAKYPEMSGRAYGGLIKLCSAVNQALDPWIYKYFGGKPEKLGGFSPDEAFEAVLTGALDLTMFFNERTPKEALDYFNEISKLVFEEIMPALSYMDQNKYRASAVDIIEWIGARTREKDELPEYVYKGSGADTAVGVHGDRRQEVEIPMSFPKKRTKAESDEEYKARVGRQLFNKPKRLQVETDTEYVARCEAWVIKTEKTCKAYRQMGARVIFPDLADEDFHQWITNEPRFKKEYADLLDAPEDETIHQRIARQAKIRSEAERLGYKLKNPYIVWGNEPVYEFPIEKYVDNKAYGTIFNRPQAKMTRKGTLSGSYGHRGGEALMLLLITTVAMDKQVITKADAEAIRVSYKKRYGNEDWFSKTFNQLSGN